MTELSATAVDFRRALLAVRDARSTTPAAWTLWVNLLKTQHRMPGQTVTSTKLAEVNGLSSYSLANLRYGGLSQQIATHLGYVAPNRTQGDRKPMWWTTLSTAQVTTDDRAPDFEYTMRAELAEAIEMMGWVKPAAVVTG